jgi:F0F1-type ATP synthase membrane subunit a
MFLTVALISILMIGGMAGWRLVPGRFQSLAEITYEFVASMIRTNTGRGRHEIRPFDLLAVHVHLRFEPRRHPPLHVYNFEPYH